MQAKCFTLPALLLAAAITHAAPAWQNMQVYQAGDTITEAGIDYRAQWWTQGQTPQQHSGPPGSGQPWLVLNPAEPPLACGDAWRPGTAYNGNSVVSRQGRNYLASWWSSGSDPAINASSPWRDLGSCNYLASYSYDVTAQQVQPLAFAGQTLSANYRIQVRLPAQFNPDRAYPVLYVLDWFVLGAGVTVQYQALEASGKIQPLILVGVDCPDSIDACWLRRERDYTPAWWQAEEDYLGNTDPNLQITGGGPRLLALLRDQVIPRIETRYLANTAARGLHGTSLSGLFAADVLVRQPGSFGRYLINSPSLWYQDGLLISQAQAAPASQFATVQHAFFSMGELEGQPYLQDTATLASVISARQVPVQNAVFAGRDHETAGLDATTAGLLSAYPR
ncbi:Predicted hydrolase of the alpha/beta superfamily [Andreprevotia lacus DSM 23236]|uniref:Predicted hydrolase of the alpha/beta superfamily n=1 Tax=Andreprevotia lacus DSM 23236 TaxID=1121001 RepID=A0A1W1Y0B7_9NEIS|nr:carbohydrate-binding protein [Andreprevotia lacus]SMC29660.1 Predicted hydrolase of the alpha/beta superfamily [Andreprevotia lacus DSM 23236]